MGSRHVFHLLGGQHRPPSHTGKDRGVDQGNGQDRIVGPGPQRGHNAQCQQDGRDGKDDILWRDTGIDTVSMWLMDGLTAKATGFILNNADWSLAATGDYNGDGKSDILWAQASTGNVVEWQMDGFAATATGFISSGPTWVVEQ